MRWTKLMAVAVALLAVRSAHAGEVSPLLLYPPRGDETAIVRASVRLVRPPDRATIARLERLGARPVRIDGDRLALSGRVLSVEVARAALKRLARLDVVERIEPAVPLLTIRPLDLTAAKIGAHRVWAPPPPKMPVLGTGVVVADHERGWDPFHPDFFFPDGGVFDFEDVDGDRRLGPGDRVLLPCRARGCDTTLALLEGVRDDVYTGEIGWALPGYQPDVDWLYVDADGDGARSFGAWNGFSDLDPALGEPIFVGDDVDGDGVLELGERLVQLSTPKVRAIWWDGFRFDRGVNLSTFDATANDPFHGTGASGIVAGGWPGLRRYSGVAPGAELVFIASSDAVAGLAAAEMLGADVSLYEWDSPIEFHDGSSNFELALSEAAARGMVQLTAVGNLAGADHCMKIAPVTSSVSVARVSTDGRGIFQFGAFYMSLTWRGELDDVALAITAPGERFDFTGEYSEGSVAGIFFQVWRSRSSRGTSWALAIAASAAGGPLPNVELALEASATTTIDQLRGLLFDDQSGWGKGVSWLDHLTDEGSALMPSTADAAIGVAAYGGVHDLSMFGWGGIDERRSYSGIGPRIDGERVVDLSAPDDPFSPGSGAGLAHGAYASFGGTSGALPHVAGAAALVRGAFPSMPHADVEQLLQGAAVADRFTGAVPNREYGHGKLDVYRAVFGEAASEGAPPSITLTAEPAVVARTRTVTWRAAVDDVDTGSGSVLVAWDLDYDREYERAAANTNTATLAYAELGRYAAVAQAIDPSGRTARALAIVEVVESCLITGCNSGCCGEDETCGTCPMPDAGLPADATDAATPIAVDASSQFDAAIDGSAAGGDVMIAPPGSEGCGCTSAADRSRAQALWWLALLFVVARAVKVRA